MKTWLGAVIVLCAVFFAADHAHAAGLDTVSDLISTSAPSTTTATHTITFTTATAIPASGKIVITPQAGQFSIPSGFDYTDIDLATSSGGAFADRALAASPSATDDGVSVTTGSSGSITITLNSAYGIGAGVIVQVQLGTNAAYGTTGDRNITNPSSATSYRIAIETRNASDTVLDSAKAMIAIVPQVTATATMISTAPTRSNGYPSGQVEAGHDEIEIALTTDMAATCRYATTTGVLYSNMLGTTTAWNASSTIHYQRIIGHLDNTAYNYYVRCINQDNVFNTDDFAISFTINPTPEFQSSVTLPSAGPGGAGEFRGGSSLLFRAAPTVSGLAPPTANIVILMDGKQVGTTQTKPDGSFFKELPPVERGTYTFSVFAFDDKGRKSAPVSSTLFMGAGSFNTIANLIVPPTISLLSDQVSLAEDVVVSGAALPNGKVELFVKKQGSIIGLDTKRYPITASPKGVWQFKFNSRELSKGTWQVSARVSPAEHPKSSMSTTLYLGVGEAPVGEPLGSDVNGDSKVNLIDFSIMLSAWGTSNPNADFNGDGTVNLADFSILLFNWTG